MGYHVMEENCSIWNNIFQDRDIVAKDSGLRTQDSGLRQNLFNMNIYSITIHQVYTSMSI